MATGNRIPRPNPLETPELSEFDDYGTTIRDWTSPWAGGKISAASLLRLAHRFLDFGIQEAHLSFLTYPRNLLLTDPDIASTKADGEWEAARLLGTGSYGAVGLWRKFTESRVITDEMAIKHVNLKGIGNIAKSTVSTHEGLLKEAIFMSNLNRAKDSHNINILRQYQYNKPANLARFYMICCTHGDLSDIQERYMVWDTYLPENFIWHVFIQFAMGLQTMGRPPGNEHVHKQPAGVDWKTAYLVHLDLKPATVLLDYASTSSGSKGISMFPYLRITDFGGSTYTSDSTAMVHNVSSTDQYRLPKHLKYAKNKTKEPYWRKPHNVWALGKTIFDITFHAEAGELHEDMNSSDNNYLRDGPIQDGHFAPHNMRYYAEVFHRHRQNDPASPFAYSPGLLKLIRDCLHPEPKQRPTSSQILQRTRDGQRGYLSGLKSQHGINEDASAGDLQAFNEATRLYFVGNEVNKMTLGRANFDGHKTRKLFGAQPKHADPDLPVLNPPASRYDSLRPDGARQAIQQIPEYVVTFGDQIVSLKDIQIVGGKDPEAARVNARRITYEELRDVELQVEIICRREENGVDVSIDDVVDGILDMDRGSLVKELIEIDVAQGKLTETPGLMLRRRALAVKYYSRGRELRTLIKERVKSKTILADKEIPKRLRPVVLARLDQLEELRRGDTQAERSKPMEEVEQPAEGPTTGEELLESRR